MNFLLAPANLSGVLTHKIQTKTHDPIEILLYNLLNSVVTTSFIYLIFHVFHSKYFGFMLAGSYLMVTTMIGLVVGTVDQAFYLDDGCSETKMKSQQ
jgi:uncharacterized ion transporter superfamily protein YfcC